VTAPRDGSPLAAAEASTLPGGGANGAGPGVGSNAPFVTTLRARPGEIVIGPAGATDALTVRVQMPEVWDVVRVVLPAAEPVLTLKLRALEALYPEAAAHEQFVLKLGGFEVIDEGQSVAETGAVTGSTFLLTHRRRRPVR
jgi:hypothetical protein